MATAVYDSVRCLKLESPSEGGTQLDLYPSELTTTQDAVAAAGLYIDGPSVTTPDKQVLVDRNNNNLQLNDPNAGTKTASELVSATLGAVSAHQSLVDMAHFVGAPADGWVSGSYRKDTYSGLQVSSSVWYTSSNQSKKIYAETYQYNGALVASCTCALYASDGTTIVRQLVETYGYTGLMLTTVTRTWS